MGRKELDIAPQAPAPNVVQLVAQYGMGTEIAENVMHFTSGAAPTTTTMNALIDAYIAWETAQGSQIRPNVVGLNRLVATDLTTPTGPVVDRQVLPVISGVGVGQMCPNNVTVAVAVRTAKRGRSYRGRIYHIGVPVSHCVGSQLLAAERTDYVTRYSLLLALGVAPIFNLGVLSRQQNGNKINPAIFTPATSITIDINLDSQRRRLPGHNRHR